MRPKDLIPLQQWICDGCGDRISSIDEGYLEWIDDENGRAHSFYIFHNRKQPGFPTCSHYRGRKLLEKDLPLDGFTGSIGLARLLSFIDKGPLHDPEYSGPRVSDLREFTEIFRRLMLPHYEEARMYWDRALADGFFGSPNEVFMYMPSTCEDLVERYRETDD